MKNIVIEKAIKECKGQHNLAVLVGVAQPSVSSWLNGGGIKGRYIPLIAKATGYKITESEILQSISGN